MKKLYKNVLLLDGKIVNWKTGTTHWDCVDKAFCNRQPEFIWYYNEDRLSVSSIMNSFDEDNTESINKFFEDKNFHKQFQIHEDFPSGMFRPY